MRGSVCRCKAESHPPEKCSPGKHPITRRGLHDASVDPEQIKAWFDVGEELNVGIAVPDGMVIIDVDPRNGGNETYVQILTEKGLPATRAVNTGGGGLHLYYRVPAGYRFPGKLGRGIDLKQLGGYVLAPPSNHESGRNYELASQEIADAPPWLVAMGTKRLEPLTREAQELEFDEELSDIDHAAVAALLAPHYCSGNFHKGAMHVGGYLKNRGYTSGDAEKIVGDMAEHAGSNDPDARAKDATGAWRYVTPTGYSGLKEWAPADVLERLGILLPDKEREKRAAMRKELEDAAWTKLAQQRQQQAAPAPQQTAVGGLSSLVSNQSKVATVAPHEVEQVGTAELTQLSKSLKGKKRTHEEKLRGAALGRLLAGLAVVEDDLEASMKVLTVLAVDIARTFPTGDVDTSLLATGLHRSGNVPPDLFHAKIVEEQVIARQIGERRLMTDQRRRAAGLSLDDSGAVKNTLGNVTCILTTSPEWEGVIRYDMLGCRVAICSEPPITAELGSWRDEHTTRLRVWIENNYDFSPSKENAEAAVDEVAKRNSFHPVREYLNGLKWDGRPRIDALWVYYFGAPDNRWHRVTGSKFAISAVARAFGVIGEGGAWEPAKVDTMPVLEGPQGLKKSTGIRVLCGGDDWFSDTHLEIGNKDAIQQLDGVWIAEIADMSGMKGKDVNTVKNFLTSKQDNIRRSYARRSQKEPRQTVFVATTNDDIYLQDPTGARRFWPVHCRGPIRIEEIRRDRDQLWAEAVQRFRAGEIWYLQGDEITLSAEETELRTVANDPWEELLAGWADKRGDGFQMKDALAFLSDHGARDTQADATRAGIVLKRLGWHWKRVADDDGARSRRYYREKGK